MKKLIPLKAFIPRAIHLELHQSKARSPAIGISWILSEGSSCMRTYIIPKCIFHVYLSYLTCLTFLPFSPPSRLDARLPTSEILRGSRDGKSCDARKYPRNTRRNTRDNTIYRKLGTLSKNNLRGVTLETRPIWENNSHGFILSFLEQNQSFKRL